MYFSHMTYLISHVTSLNNTCRWSYKLSHSRLLQTGYKSVCSKTLSLYIFFLIFRTKLLETTHSLYIPKTKEVSSLSLSKVKTLHWMSWLASSFQIQSRSCFFLSHLHLLSLSFLQYEILIRVNLALTSLFSCLIYTSYSLSMYVVLLFLFKYLAWVNFVCSKCFFFSQ